MVVIPGERIIDYLYFPLNISPIFQIFYNAHAFPVSDHFKSFSNLASSTRTIFQSPNALSLLPVSSLFSLSSMLLWEESFSSVDVFMEFPTVQRARSKPVGSVQVCSPSLALQFLTNKQTFLPLPEQATDCGFFARLFSLTRTSFFPFAARSSNIVIL